ncbi:YhcN/YlaJ family sporulation lipoprotein [Anoxybacteroides rupiense]|uniref:YhcN/YlaJ family sporulation lipoprotein n=1 Tax=Anoxybacteroides rupiense TaxID=311460 RepID=UPI001606AD08|nr:YhcN/YlaJ family sporulation lipoprotein [Anoxybacillus rupiensis]MBB3907445.1 preprotein translocase subunit SecF [Anoxybacillus rupiensis]
MMKKVTLLLVCSLFIVGCAREPEVKDQSLQGKNMIRLNTDGTAHSATMDQSAAQQAVNDIKQKQAIRDAVAVNTKNKLFLAYQVKHMERFHKKQIEKEVQKQLKERFPQHQVVISSDLKLFWKTNELKKQLQKTRMGERKLNEEIEKLKKLSEETA